jgi:hypothetical protein
LKPFKTGKFQGADANTLGSISDGGNPVHSGGTWV